MGVLRQERILLLVCLLWGFADFSAKLGSLDFQQIRAMIIPVPAASSLCSCVLFIRCQSLSCVQVQNQVTLHIPYNTVGGRCIYLLARCVNNSNTLSPPFFLFVSSFMLFRYFQRITARFAICKKPPPSFCFCASGVCV